MSEQGDTISDTSSEPLRWRAAAGGVEWLHGSAPRYSRALLAGSLGGLGLICAMSLVVGWWCYHRQMLSGLVLVLGVLGWIALGGGQSILRGSAARWVLWVSVLAMGLRLACVLGFPYAPSADFRVFHEAGVHMAREWMLGTGCGYRCYYPPGQVFTLGVVYRLFGDSVTAAQVLNCVWATLTVVGVWYVGREMFGETAGRVASLLAALLPSTIFGCMLLGAETPETFWLMAALVLYVVILRRPEWAGRLGLASGLCLGIGTLIRPTYLLLWAPIGLHLLLSWPKRRGRALAAAFGLAVGTAAAVAPWTARNYAVTGGFIPVSSNAGQVLYQANNDLARGDYCEPASAYIFSVCPDDLTLYRDGQRKAVAWIRGHPRRFGELAIRKFGLFWALDKEPAWWALEQPKSDHPGLDVPLRTARLGQAVSTGYYTGLLAAAAFGLWRRRRQAMAAAAGWGVIAAMAAYFTAVHMVFESQGKYHFMLVPLLCVLAASWFSPAAKGTGR